MTEPGGRTDAASRIIHATPAAVCEQVPYGIGAEDHQVGLASTLANLAAHVE